MEAKEKIIAEENNKQPTKKKKFKLYKFIFYKVKPLGN